MLTPSLDLTPALSSAFLHHKFSLALPYESYLDTSPSKIPAWLAVHNSISLTHDQQSLLASFSRSINLLCISGMWCGDCSAQCPILAHFAAANPARISLRFLDRDQHLDLADLIAINAGHRVPSVLFLSEDFHFISLLADRTLSRYRAVAAKQLGPACPLPGSSADLAPDLLAATTQDWLNELERVHLLLRLSPRLRQLHND